MLAANANWIISIHALRKESDDGSTPSTSTQSQFQSTLSVRRATFYKVHLDAVPSDISIHALRKESDLTASNVSMYALISIHALRKESDSSGGLLDLLVKNSFQSTLSVRRATPPTGSPRPTR